MTQTLHFHLHDVAGYINWLYFFHAWGLPARLASVTQVHGCTACRNAWIASLPADIRPRAQEAISLFDDAQQLISLWDSRIHTHARIAVLDAHSQGEDIVTSEGIIPLLRQQTAGDNGFCLCLSDFVRPSDDKIGLFVCSTDASLEQSEPNDDYRHLLCQTVADRLAEATAEKMHEEVRRKWWGYAPDEQLTIDQLFREEYQGIRPAVGYPSLPDQSLNFVLDRILDFGQIGVTLTENGAMRPHASTSGLMIAHPKSHHFSVGSIGEDQIEDYAKRRGLDPNDIKRFLWK